MTNALNRTVLALLLMVAVGSLCVASCFASATPEKQSAHACCPKSKAHKQPGDEHTRPARECDGQPAEAARNLMVAAPEFTPEPVRVDMPQLATYDEREVVPVASPPDLLTLHHILLI